MTDNKIIIDDERSVTLDSTPDSRPLKATTDAQYVTDTPKDSYEGRKYKPEIDGPQQASQETDEIYSDPRKEEDLPPGGKNVADLNAADLSQEGNL